MASSNNILGRYAALSFCRADVLLQVGRDLDIKFCSGPTQAVFGKVDKDLVGTPLLDLVHRYDRSILEDLVKDESLSARIDDLILRANTASDRELKIGISGYRVPDFENDFFIAIKIAPKQTIPVGSREEDKDQASGVMNNEAFVDAAAQRVKSHEASGGHAKVSMVKIGDLNEAGIEAGSAQEGEVLKAIGDVLNSESLGGDTAGRIDDENFSLVHDDDVDALALSEKISNALTKTAPEATSLIPKIATIDADASGMDEQQMAKAMLYSLQEFTKNDGEIPDGDLASMLEQSLQRNMEAVERFRGICDRGSFDLVYMPVCRLNDGSVHHYEALTRFRDDAGESPFQLITLAEEVGVISEFDLCVAERAIKTLLDAGFGENPTPVAINVSGHSIGEEDFRSNLHKLLDDTPGVSEFISLEITESAEISDLKGVNEALQTFRRDGFKVALDDFGAGAASFDYLNSFDVDTVKFDGPVVKRAVATQKGKAFLASMATLCHEIEVETIAEMVEDQELADFLAECGIELGQGWHFGKPMPDIDAFPSLSATPAPAQQPAAPAKPAAPEDEGGGLSLLERLNAGEI